MSKQSKSTKRHIIKKKYDIKISMKKNTAILNIISNYIIQNQSPKH